MRPKRRSGPLPDVRVAQRAALEWGVLSSTELAACGLSRDGIVVRVGNGRLHPRYRGVFAVGHPNLPLEGHFLAAVKACGPTARLSRFSAASLFEFVEWDYRDPEVTVLGPGTRTPKGVHVHRTRTFAPQDVTSYRGIPVTSPARTLVDLASTLSERTLRRAVRQAQSLGRVTLPELLDALSRMRGRRGIRKLAAILASGPAPTRSVLEDAVLDLMLTGGLEHPDVNVPLMLSGRRVVPDFRWPGQRLVVEADGAAWHDSKTARDYDAERQALLEAHGERVVRVTWDQVLRNPTQTLARLRAAGAPSDPRASS